MEEQTALGQWLKERCKKEHLSLREAGAKTSLSAATIGKIIKGNHPLPATIRRLAQGFGGDGSQALEDRLLVLAGYRREEPGRADYLKIIPLLSPEHRRVVEVLVMELAKIEGIEVPTEPTRGKLRKVRAI